MIQEPLAYRLNRRNRPWLPGRDDGGQTLQQPCDDALLRHLGKGLRHGPHQREQARAEMVEQEAIARVAEQHEALIPAQRVAPGIEIDEGGHAVHRAQRLPIIEQPIHPPGLGLLIETDAVAGRQSKRLCHGGTPGPAARGAMGPALSCAWAIVLPRQDRNKRFIPGYHGSAAIAAAGRGHFPRPGKAKRPECHETSGSGGGTRTPDTRIMIPLL